MKALVQNQLVEGTIKFFRPPADGKAVSEHFYTIEFKSGRVESVQQSGSSDVPMESVTFAYRAITCTFVKGGVTHADDWSKGK
jgi:type VI secretion system secreted protein Hcp